MTDPAAPALKGPEGAREVARAPLRPALLTCGVTVAVGAAVWLRWARREPALATRTRARLRSAASEDRAA